MPSRNRKCELIVDSCCDLPRDLLAMLDVEVLHFPYLVGDVEFTDDLWASTSPEEFYGLMRSGADTKTMQLPVPVLFETFTRVLQSGVPTVYLSFSSALSGSFDMARRVLADLAPQYPQGELYVVDTRLASIAEGVIAIEACRQRDRGLGATELAAWVEESRNYVHGYFTLDNFDALRKGGRIPAVGAYVGAKLDVKPVLTFGEPGNLVMSGMTRGRKKSLKELQKLFSERAVDTDKLPIVVGNADCRRDEDGLFDYIGKEAPGAMIVRTAIGPVIGSHVGPGMVAVAFFGTDRREVMNLADRIASKVSQGTRK